VGKATFWVFGGEERLQVWIRGESRKDEICYLEVIREHPSELVVEFRDEGFDEVDNAFEGISRKVSDARETSGFD